MRKAVLLGTLVLAAACSKKEVPAGAVKVEVKLEGFSPGCVEISAADASGHASTSTLNALARGDTKVLALEGEWGGGLQVTARAFERTCGDHPVAEQVVPVTLPSTGVESLTLTLTAPDEDQDGYVAVASGGTDCNDAADGGAAFHPGLTELCNGEDENCDGERDEGLPRETYYRDDDRDGYGRNDVTAQACQPPGTNWALEGGDCDEGDAAIHPDATELCNAVDENCVDGPTDGYPVGDTCTVNGCGGAYVCGTATSASCEVPTYYADLDGDGHGAGPAVTSCAGVTVATVDDDCDDANPTRHPGASDVCDQRDNACAVGGDVDPSCPGAQWATSTQDTATWNAASAFAVGGVWFAGDNQRIGLQLPGVAFASKTSDCTGASSPVVGNWKATWVDSAGDVYLGGEDSLNTGKGFVAKLTQAGDCAVTGTAGTSTPVQGVFGVEDGSGGLSDLFAVTADGKVYRNGSSGPKVGEILNGIHGSGLANLYTVGRYANGPKHFPAAFRLKADGTGWTNLALDSQIATLQDGDALQAVYVLDATHVYLVGDRGVAILYDGSTPTLLPVPPGAAAASLRSVVAVDPASVYVAASNDTIYRWDGSAWENLADGFPNSFTAITGKATDDLWAAGAAGQIVHWHEP